jgi:Ca2+-binding EF-hand superfamily protein
MEVSLVEMQGLPPGCLVSVRMGSTRRQAPADPEKLRLMFPKGCSPKDSIKVDLLAPVGSAEMPFAPDANLYPLQVPINGALANITLGLREAPADMINKPEKPPPAPGFNLNSIYASMDFSKDDNAGSYTPHTASRRHKIALEARTYLDKHQILSFVHGLLQALIRDRPIDPWDFVIECAMAAKKLGSKDDQDDDYKQRVNAEVMQKAADADELGQATPVITRPTSATEREAKVEEPSKDLMQQVAGALEKVQPAKELYDIQGLCSSLSSSLLEAAVDGRLQRLLADRAATEPAAPVETSFERIKELRVKTQQVLLQANRDGRLQDALMQSEAGKPGFAQMASVGTWLAFVRPNSQKATGPSETEKTRETLQKAMLEAHNLGIMETIVEDIMLEDRREKAQAALMKACEDGSLAAALEKSAEDPRAKTQAALMKACEDGSLATALENLLGEVPREKAQAALMKACEDGSLAAAVVKLLGEEPHAKTQAALMKACEDGSLAAVVEKLLSEVPREKTQAALMKACEDGSLAAAIEQLLSEDPRAKMQAALIKACEDGSLEAAVVEALRQQTHAALIKACANGSLESVLGEEKRSKTQSALLKACEDGSLADSVKTMLSQDTRVKTQSALLKACKDGSLAEALEEVAIEAMREQTHAALFKACVDGSLESVLGEASSATPTFMQKPSVGTWVSQAPWKAIEHHLLELHFGHDFDNYDHPQGHKAFKDALMTGFEDLGAHPDHHLPHLVITLRAGSVVAEVRGPPHCISHLKGLELHKLEVHGHPAHLSAEALKAAPPPVPPRARKGMGDEDDDEFTKETDEAPPPVPPRARKGMGDEDDDEFTKETDEAGPPPPLPPKRMSDDDEDDDEEFLKAENARVALRDVLVEAHNDGRFENALKDAAEDKKSYYAKNCLPMAPAAYFDQLHKQFKNPQDELRRKAERMLEQATKEEEFMKMLQEAAQKAGYEFELKPKGEASASEPSADAKEMFHSIDANNDGIITPKEFAAAYEKGMLQGDLAHKVDDLSQKVDFLTQQLAMPKSESKEESAEVVESLQFREKTRHAVVKACHDGSLLDALDVVHQDRAPEHELLELHFAHDFEKYHPEDHPEDHEAFKGALMNGLQDLGAHPDDHLPHLVVTLRAGSVVAEVRGPPHCISHLRGLELHKLHVHGHPAHLSAEALKAAGPPPVPPKSLKGMGDEDEEDDEEGDDDLHEGDAVIERSTSSRGSILKRTKTDCLVQMEDGQEVWKSRKGLDKVPKLNLARAIEIQQDDLSRELTAPANCAYRGDEVVRRGSGLVGRILERTTTDCLVQGQDGTQAWVDVEDLEMALKPATGARDGELVVHANRGNRGRCKTKTDGEILILHDDGHEEWYKLEEVGVPKAMRVPPPPPLLPFASYYAKNFKGTSFVEGLAKNCAPPSPEPKKKSFAANRALKRTLKTGEIGKIVDKMEEEDRAQEDRAAPLVPFKEYYSNNFRGADIVQGLASSRNRSPSPKARDLFRRIDQNQDGVVNMDEFKTAYVKGVVTRANSLSPPPPRSSPGSITSAGSDATFAALEERIRQRNERLMRERVSESVESSRKESRKEKSLSSSSSAPTLGSKGVQSGKQSELEDKIRQRNDRFRRENEALLRENRRLKELSDSKKTGDQIAGQNDELRKELDGKRSGPS